MSKDVANIDLDMSCLKAASAMWLRKFRRSPVTHKGKLVGIVSVVDVHRAIFKSCMTSQEFVRYNTASMNIALKIILVDENTGRSAMLRRALQDKGHEVICRMDSSANLQDSNEMTHADVVIVNADIPDNEVFANLTDVNKTKPKPIVMFTEESNSEMASSAIKSGVNAYIVDGLEENRVQPIIDVAMARFREFQALKDELDATRNQLSERKAVEKAKGLLMKHKDINEDDAYQSLRKMAMDKNKRIVDVAESVINAFELLD